MGRTSDARKEIASPSHLGGAGRAHVEGEWLGRMFRAGAGRHAWQISALVARGARAGVRGAALGRQPPPCTIGIRPEFRVQFWKCVFRSSKQAFCGG